MKELLSKQKSLLVLGCVLAMSIATPFGFGQSDESAQQPSSQAAVPGNSSMQSQVQQMRQQLRRQQHEIDELKQLLENRNNAASQPAGSVSPAEGSQSFENLRQAVEKIQAQSAEAQQTASTVQQDQSKLKKAILHPDAVRYKGITISPKGSFLAAETVNRTSAAASGINTAFTGIPLQYSPASKLSEFYATGRQSRIALKATGKLPDMTLTGYYEMDWLSAGADSNNNQSNSYTVRQRQLWAEAALNSGWTFNGGQGWSLVTETTHLLKRGTEILPATIDAQYEPGFVWTRQYSFRVTKDLNSKFAVGIAVENAETLNPAGQNLPTNVLIGSGGSGGGHYNPGANYSFNLTPDFVAKIAADPGWGHWELFGIGRSFRDRIYPTVGSPYNNTVWGGGIGGGFRVPLADKKISLGLKGLYGEGVGRYGSSTIADITFRPDGTISPLHGFSTLSTVEFNPNKRLNVYFNYGGDYIGRDWAFNSEGQQVGYGTYTADMSGCRIEPASTAAFPGSDPSTPGNSTNKCSGNNKDVQEFTAGYWFYIHNGRKGGLRQGIQYSNIRRDLWSGAGGTLNPSNGAHGNDNMVFTSFRYYLP